jgi:hypothetical protein
VTPRRYLSIAVCIIGCGMAAVFFDGAVARPLGDVGWTIYGDERGTHVDYPARLLSVSADSQHSGGQRFMTADSRAALEIFTRPSEGQSPRRYLAKHFPGSRSALDYDRVARNFFAVSMESEKTVLYRRCNFAGGTIHCIELSYPTAEKKDWDDIVTRISRSLRPL